MAVGALKNSVQYLKGVGPKRAVQLSALGLSTVEDLLYYFPRSWEDRKETPPPRAPESGHVVLKGRVVRASAIFTRGSISLYKCTLNVPSWGDTIEAVWFKRMSRRYDVFQTLKAEVKAGADIWIVGRAQDSLLKLKEVQVDEYYGLDDPKAGFHVGRIVPVYAATEGVSTRQLREWVAQALQESDHAQDLLPRALVEKRGLLAAPQALRGLHFPRSIAEMEEARKRLAYEELLLLELAWLLKQRQTKAGTKGFAYELKRHLLTPFRQHLGFELTAAQKRVINEIFGDMQAHAPMTRMLQGDVGSGKTVVAVAALLLAVENGYQGAFMAPTEILAEQHYWTLTKFLKDLPVRLRLVTSRLKPKERAEALAALRDGTCDIAIGTHALIEGDVAFKDLRLAVIDEQHRFGVRQRSTLRQKGPPMDLLIMTATPIPRTLALAMFGDLDVSTLDEMPPGRAQILTTHGTEEEAFARVRQQAQEGRQAYIVYPIISESSRVDLKAAKAEFERLKAGALAGLRTELIHGQMSGTQKTKIMEAFARGRCDVLVATPVVEVGMDIPNATVMVIQNADRFGLASLHQLRGRVGRAGHASECWLVADPQTEAAKRRIAVLCETADGFRIGEEDLKLRGPGEILGTAQHGELSLAIADLFRDAEIQAQARADGQEMLDADPKLAAPQNAALRRRLVDLYQNRWHMVDLA
ncbi:MAG: ATP-dependent DNA helicase RecG [Elusimicrobia bacterium]|nr:ATP-dependent DNA helicase RecG [Elusimicrobiota bacterium]